jgi:hypothetical protein
LTCTKLNAIVGRVLSILLLSTTFSSLIALHFVDPRMNQLGHLSGIPVSQKLVGEVPPSLKESSTSLADSLPRFGDMNPKLDMSTSSGKDTIVFDSPKNLSS